MTTMHVAVDASGWGAEERGVAAASRRLWSAYVARAAAPTTALAPLHPKRGAARVAWQQFVLPSLARTAAVDLLHCPSYTVPLAARCRTILTVHDLIASTHPRLAGWKNALHLRLLVARSVVRASAVCVPTDVVRTALLRGAGVDAARVFVVPWGVDEFTPIDRGHAIDAVRKRFGIDEPFVFFCGCIEPKKNLPAAVAAANAAGLPLVAAGPWIASSARIAASITGRWRYAGYVTTAELRNLYSAASAFVFPSLVEGFGLPPLEAMACGTPVVASDDPALREICGGAAVHVPHGDGESLATSLRRVVRDPHLHAGLAARGRARAAEFEWRRAAAAFSAAVDYACAH